MLENKTYSDKEVDIFEGVISLIEKGINLYDIKVSDIAQSANIGKGTIYDYFSSKEEVISKALLYYMDREIQTFHNKIIAKKGFKECYYEILFTIKDRYRSNMFVLDSILSSRGSKETYKNLSHETCNTRYFFQTINDLIIKLLEMGKKEDLVIVDEDMYYFSMCIRGAIFTFYHYIAKEQYYETISIKKAMDTSYKILLKSLS